MPIHYDKVGEGIPSTSNPLSGQMRERRFRPVAIALLLVAGIVPPSALAAESHQNAAAAYDAPGSMQTPAVPNARYFVENRGQVSDLVRYYTLGNPAAGFRDDGVMIVAVGETTASSVFVEFEGARHAPPLALRESQFKLNFFTGRDSGKWFSDVPSYEEIVYRDLYQGIDLVYRAEGGQLKYEFRVSPGSNPAAIALGFRGASAVRAGGTTAAIELPLGTLIDSIPASYELGGSAVDCSFSMKGRFSYGFSCPGWGGSRTLVIDPLMYSTFIGGTAGEYGYALAADSTQAAYVAGYTWSTDFPATAGSYDTTASASGDVFVSKLNPYGTALLYSTYIGGAGREEAHAITLDQSGNVYVAGLTESADFPVTAGAYSSTLRGVRDAFVAKLNAAGNALTFSTYLGGTAADRATGMALDPANDVYLVGDTYSNDFPTTAGAFDTTFNGGGDDVFVTKMNSAGTGLVYSTFLGGTASDGYSQSAIFVDGAGLAYVAGETASNDFPTTAAAYQRGFGGGTYDAFVVKLNAGGTGLVYSTFLGARGSDWATSIAVDAAGSAYVTGYTSSRRFPTTAGAFQTGAPGGTADVFITKLNAGATALTYSTYLGTAGDDEASSIGVDSGGAACVTGYTDTAGFPTTAGAYDTTLNGGRDAFVTRMNAGGTALLYSTYLGGAALDFGYALAACTTRGIFVAGQSMSADFPTTFGALDRTLDGPSDAFVSRIVWANSPPVANAGTGFSLARNSLGNLDGTASSDPDADALSYLWTQTAGPGETITNPTSALATIRPQSLGMHTFSLNVSDPYGGYSVDSVNVDVYNIPPVANAGLDSSTVRGVVINLVGSGSTDANGDTLAYRWTQAAGPAVTINNPTSAVAWFVPMTMGTYVFQLNVSDPYGAWSTDIVNVTTINRPPVANAGPDRTVPVNVVALLDGTASSDPDNDPLMFGWMQLAGPAVTITNRTQAIASFIPPTAGLYRFSVTTTDNYGGIDVDEVNITAQNLPPIANAGPDQVAFRNVRVDLDGTGSSDPEGGALTFAWSQIAGPAVALNGANTATPWFTPSLPGIYTFRLNVTDDGGATASDDVSITVNNRNPVANAGPDQNVQKNILITLDGSASSDPDGDTLTFAWSQLAGPAVTLTGAATSSPTFTPARAGTYTFRLNVSDGYGGSASDDVSIVVTNRNPIAEAGLDRSVSVGTLVALDGSGSSDPDGDTLSYLWSQTSGAPVVLTGANTATPTFTPNSAGLYQFKLDVGDGDGGSNSDSVIITALQGNPPTAKIGVWPATTGYMGIPIVFDGLNSTDSDGSIVNYDWTFGDTGSASGARVSHVYSSKATFQVNLTVTDNDGMTDSDTVTISIVNRPPVITSWSPPALVQRIKNGTLQLFTVIASDPDNDALTFEWKLGGTVVGGNSQSHNFVEETVGVYVLNVTVSDGSLQDWLEWTITVNATGGNGDGNNNGNNTPAQDFPWTLLIVALVIVVVVVFLLVIFLAKRRKKPQEGQIPPPPPVTAQPPMMQQESGGQQVSQTESPPSQPEMPPNPPANPP